MTGTRLRVLLVEDDPGDAFLVGELLSDSAGAFDLAVAASLAQAQTLLANTDCVLLDLGLPDAEGIDGLRRLLAMAGSAAVCVLTGRSDEHLGMVAVAEGAQDYLIKGQVDGLLLGRALRYAVERKRADENAHRLHDVELLQAESARLERGLLPKPLMSSTTVQVHTFYRSGRAEGLLGGDFYDVVQTGQTLRAIVGDVGGHGADDAALGARLRVAWRALVLAGVPDDRVIPALEQVLVSERRIREVFTTVAMTTLDLDNDQATVRLAGHPPPVLLAGGTATLLPARTGLMLGVESRPVPAYPMALPSKDWSLLMYTDGLIGPLDQAGLCRLLVEAGQRTPPVPVPALPGWLVDRAERASGGRLADDVAMLLITRGQGR
ncbi:serine phosphatase RsbU (regulator of sigma subunit) [Actinoplanes lutulentus]|uniref:Response regulator receiver domain-containing protein n=1 Tax=Actinoplanes lutulentus TaxID=1287878 RepID=A0A327Z3K1_9ACTN|nr:SpoIIE family protein phosphatase [Actinoplanes lutulentus]MBB2948891.1 serine phosphatase RsbU (regulator of sigma subunit) [Actinoplanes lutulentus]RAK29801.1 response regulator receiver domain-containing protein [Actinoplanes lutulentus]